MLRIITTVICIITAVFTLSSCTSDSFDNNDQINLDNFEVGSESSTSYSDTNGSVTYNFNIGSNVSKFSLTAIANGNYVEFSLLSDPTGKVIYTGQSLYDANGDALKSPHLKTISYPLLPSDSPPIPGQYTAVFRLSTPNAKIPEKTETLFHLTSRFGQNLQDGILNINAILAGPVSGNENTQVSIRNALEDCGEVLEDHGVKIAFSFIQRPDLPALLPNPNFEDGVVYEVLANQLPWPALNLYFGLDFSVSSKINDSDGRYSYISSIPQAFLPTRKNAILFSILELAGANGEFDINIEGEPDSSRDAQKFNDETLHMADVICHAIGNGLGLRNSVEFSGSTVSANDILISTPSCSSLASCRIEKDAVTNLMFPFSLLEDESNSSGKFYRRNGITHEQELILLNSNLIGND